MAKSAKIKSMTELTRSLAHSSRTEKNILEIKDKVSNYDYQMYRGKSFIDPTMTHQNYCLYNKVDEFNNLMDETYAKKDSVIAYENVLTYPHNNPPKDKDGNIIEPRDFFQKHLENLQENSKLKEHFGTLISAYVHMDETSIHMHYFTSPIEQLEKAKTKEHRYYEPKLIKKTGEMKMVQKRSYKEYHYQFNAAKMMDRKFFQEMHYDFEKAFKEKGIEVKLISDEVRQFNEFKNELEAEYSQKFKECKSEDELKETIHEYYEILKGHDPKGRQRATVRIYAEDFARDFETYKKDFYEQQVQAILDDADAQGLAIIEDAEAQAQDIKLDATKVSQMAKRKDEVATETLAKARQERAEMIEDAKDEIFNDVFQKKYRAEFEQLLSSKEYRGQIYADFIKDEFADEVFQYDKSGQVIGFTDVGQRAFRIALGNIPKTDPIYGDLMSIDEKISSVGKIEINKVIDMHEKMIKSMYESGFNFSDLSLIHKKFNDMGLISRGLNEIIYEPEESLGFEKF